MRLAPPAATPAATPIATSARAIRWVRVTYWVLLIGALAAYLVLVLRQFGNGLEFDEAYNLTVSKNLADGVGYASNGARFAGGDKLFDPFVSTGPVVLVPTALLWAASGGTLAAVRLVPILFFLLYLFVSFRLGNLVAGRWAGLAALVAPLAILVGVPALATNSLVPGRVVGEIPATALLVTAVLAFASARPVWGGVAIGLALQVKLSFLTASVIVLVVMLLARWFARRSWTRREALGCAGAVVGPTLVFEAFRALTLSPRGWFDSVIETVQFIRSETGESALVSRLGSWFGLLSPWSVVLIIASGVLVLVATVAAVRGRGREQFARPAAALDDAGLRRWMAWCAVVALALAAVAMLGAWALSSRQDSVRQGLPSMLLLLPCAAIVTVAALRYLATAARPALRMVAHAGAVTLVGGCALLVAGQGFRAVEDDSGHELLVDQQAAAKAIVDSGATVLPVDGWWQLPEYQILTDLDVPPRGIKARGPVEVFTSIQAEIERDRPDARAYLDDCGQIIVSTSNAVVCAPASVG